MATAELITYSVTDAELAKLKEQLSGLTAAQDYERTRQGIATCRQLRVDVEKRRKELKADALEYGRRVDNEAKRITALIEQIENPLQATKDIEDEKRAAAKRAKEDAERAAAEEKARAERAAEEQRLAAERERLAEQARQLAEQQAAENARLEQERAALAAERAELARQQAETERVAREQREAAERAKAAQVAQERAAAEQERKRIAAERDAAFAEQMKPDKEKAETLAAALVDFVETKLPDMVTAAGQQFVDGVADDLLSLANSCRAFAQS